MNKEEIVFYISALAYKLKVDKDLSDQLKKYLKDGESNLEVKDLLEAYIKQSKEVLYLKEILEDISNKLDVS